jgi:uncharacterized membrane protein
MFQVFDYLSLVISAIGVAIISWGVLLMVFRLLRLELSRFRRVHIYHEREILRHQLGSYMLLGLEFLIAADIIHTVTHPTLTDLAVLGSIVIIRTVISHFLDREVAAFEITNQHKKEDKV